MTRLGLQSGASPHLTPLSLLGRLGMPKFSYDAGASTSYVDQLSARLAHSKKRTRNATLPRVGNSGGTQHIDLTSADSPMWAKHESKIDMAVEAGETLSHTFPRQAAKGASKMAATPTSQFSEADNLKLLHSQGTHNIMSL